MFLVSGSFDRVCGRALRRRLCATISPLGLVAALSLTLAGSAKAQTAAPGQRNAEPLKQIDVTAPRRKPRARPAPRGRRPAVAPLPTPAPAPVQTAAERRGANSTPLN